ncbi:MAG: glutathione S-transferase family protein [Sciscionella sp.]
MSTAQFTAESATSGEFVRQANRFTHRAGSAEYPVQPGRYRLVVSLACPWAHRSIIVRRLLGLQQAISLAVVDPIRDDRGWRFTLDEGAKDPELGVAYLRQVYLATDPDYSGRVTVPCIVDTSTGTVVTNDYPQITLDFSTKWRDFQRPGAPELYPEPLRAEIDEVIEPIFRNVNNGVYRCGFASSQQAYEQAYAALFAELDRLGERLSTRRYLVGEHITEADVRLFTTLVRFDAVYHGHFKCNRSKLSEMEVLWAYARDLYSTPGFGDTVDFGHIKRHYYGTHEKINPTRIVPVGPELAGWAQPHGRESLGGTPFGDGSPPD